jgi:hypothetical protein
MSKKERVYRISTGDDARPASTRMVFAKSFADAYRKAEKDRKELNFREIVKIEYVGEVER